MGSLTKGLARALLAPFLGAVLLLGAPTTSLAADERRGERSAQAGGEEGKGKKAQPGDQNAGKDAKPAELGKDPKAGEPGKDKAPPPKGSDAGKDANSGKEPDPDMRYGILCYRMGYDGTSRALAAHIHAGGPGQNGRPVIDLHPESNGDEGCVGADPTALRNLREHPEAFYLQIHTAEYPDGAIRGQLFPTGHYRCFRVVLRLTSSGAPGGTARPASTPQSGIELRARPCRRGR